jgi:hypothetical protein
MAEFGRREWVIPGGRIPFHSTGREPDFTSRDELAVLNAGQSDTNLAITLFYPDREPVGPVQAGCESPADTPSPYQRPDFPRGGAPRSRLCSPD